MKHRAPHANFLAVALSALLLAAGAFVLACGEQGAGSTPLHEAASKGDAMKVAELIRARADTNAKDKKGQTPLHRAASGGRFPFLFPRPGREKVVIFLLQACADPNVKDKKGRTPEDVAARPSIAMILQDAEMLRRRSCR